MYQVLVVYSVLVDAFAGLPAEALAQAGVVKWYNMRFPTLGREFDSPHPHINSRITLMKTQIYSVFPGVGKTYFSKKSQLVVLDIDSSNFDKNNFPENYFKYIKSKIGKADIILISCHIEIIEKLRNAGIEFILIYPEKKLKSVYLERYKKRNDKRNFVNSLCANWEKLISRLEEQKSVKSIILKNNEYLEDVI